ncbi:hypothetical protein ALC53_02152 [Atta colombica]|uniref:Uncharacterized protein n=1 Tax=Atta colombica TaxID=520822 RepID=A0A195BS48_9HYME|nr:hypothetical protein ALC53_02152 [Atta colombica]
MCLNIVLEVSVERQHEEGWSEEDGGTRASRQAQTGGRKIDRRIFNKKRGSQSIPTKFLVRISIARIAAGFTIWLKQHFADQIRMSEPVALGPGQTYAALCRIIAVTGKSGLDNPSKSVASNDATAVQMNLEAAARLLIITFR